MEASKPRGAARVRAASLLATSLLLLALFLPGDSLPSVGLPGLDKLVHACLFASWALAVRMDFPGLGRLGLLAAGAAFGALTETGQLFAEGRAFELLDLGADLVGVFLASVAPATALERARSFYRRGFGPAPGAGKES